MFWKATQAGARRAARIAAAVTVSLLGSAPASADYAIQVGDTLELSVAGIPDLSKEATVRLDGQVSLPLIGAIQLAGVPLSEAEGSVKEQLATKVFHIQSAEGRESSVPISPEAVTLTVKNYRPIYLNGDVSSPGEQPYRPGLTVRQAIALAGGYDVMRLRATNPFLDSADFQAEHETLWAEYAAKQAEIWRLEQQLGRDEDSQRLQDLTEAPLPKSLIAEIREIEEGRMEAEASDARAEKDHLEQAIAETDEQIELLTERQAKEQEGIAGEAEDYEKLRALFKKGNASAARLGEVRRLLLLASTQALQTSVEIAASNKSRAELDRELSKVEADRKIGLLTALQEANVELSAIRSKLQAVSEKLTYTGLIRSQLVRGKGAQPELVVFRTTGSGEERLVASEDMALLPGDVIEVALASSAGQSETVTGEAAAR